MNVPEMMTMILLVISDRAEWHAPTLSSLRLLYESELFPSDLPYQPAQIAFLSSLLIECLRSLIYSASKISLERSLLDNNGPQKHDASLSDRDAKKGPKDLASVRSEQDSEVLHLVYIPPSEKVFLTLSQNTRSFFQSSRWSLLGADSPQLFGHR
jgi:hypothetical protein